MGKSRINSFLSVLLSLAVSLSFLAPLVIAQETATTDSGIALPELGPVVVDDPLASPGIVQPISCPTQRNVAQFVDEGYLMRVTGKCTDAASEAALTEQIRGLTLPDGDVRIEFRVLSGAERARVVLNSRVQPDGGSYIAAIEPGRGLVQLLLFSGGQGTVLAQRSDLAPFISLDDWNSFGLRAEGTNLWVLLNDQPIVATADSAYDLVPCYSCFDE